MSFPFNDILDTRATSRQTRIVERFGRHIQSVLRLQKTLVVDDGERENIISRGRIHPIRLVITRRISDRTPGLTVIFRDNKPIYFPVRNSNIAIRRVDKFFGENSIELTYRLGMNPPQCIRVPEFAFTAPPLQLQITMVIETINNLRRRLLRLTSNDHKHGRQSGE